MGKESGLPNPAQMAKESDRIPDEPVEETTAPEPAQPPVAETKPPEGTPAASASQKPTEGKADDNPMIPRERLNQEIQKRKDVETRLAEFEAKKARYAQLENMDAVMSEFTRQHPDKWQEVRGLIEGKKAEVAQTQQIADKQLEIEGEVSPAVKALLARQEQEIKRLSQNFSQFTTSAEAKEANAKMERAIAEETKAIAKERDEFLAKNEAYRGDEDFFNDALALASQRKMSVTTAMDYLANRDKQKAKAVEERYAKSLVANNGKRDGAKPVPSGRQAGAVDTKKPVKFDSTEHIDMIANSFD